MLSTPPSTWTTGAATIFPSVGLEIEWLQWNAGQPDMLKQVRAIGILTDGMTLNNGVSSLNATFVSNFDQEQESVKLIQPGTGWGDSWGSSPWGSGTDSAGYPTYVPMNKQYCTNLRVGVKHQNAREKISITGCAFSFEMSSDRIGR